MIGYGDIAQRLSQLSAAHYHNIGFKRSPFASPNTEIMLGDCQNAHNLAKLFGTIASPDTIVITLTPAVINEEGYRRAYLETSRRLIEALEHHQIKPRLIIFVSSTSVYGQKNGEWVDETSPTIPNSFSGKVLLEVESLWQASAFKTCIVRFSGIYGPGRRRLIEQVQQGQGTAAEPILYSNRIHADDAAAVLYHLIEKNSDSLSPLYLATDSEPTPLHEVKQWLAKAMKLADDHLTIPTEVGRSFRGSKRCSNQLLIDSGFRLQYANFREGYRTLINT